MYISTKQEKLTQKRLNELGSNPKCTLCGELEIAVLRKINKKEIPAKLLEVHHIPGRSDGETILVCRNCHVKLHNTDATNFSNLFPEINDNQPPKVQAVLKAVRFFMGLAATLGLLAFYCLLNAMTIRNYVIPQSQDGKKEEINSHV